MKLQDLGSNKIVTAKRALKETYNMPFKVEKMSLQEVHRMLTKVRHLVNETKSSPSFYKSQRDASYLKLVFMEQALASQMSVLKAMPRPRIVIENEEVEKSQVVLAAQDMVDSIQKMLEQVSDMTVKELPALIDSVQSEIGVTESEQFSQQTSEALSTLTGALTQAKTSLQGALNVITGQSTDEPDAFASAGADSELGVDSGEIDMGMDDTLPEPDAEEPDLGEPESVLGRSRR